MVATVTTKRRTPPINAELIEVRDGGRQGTVVWEGTAPAHVTDRVEQDVIGEGFVAKATRRLVIPTDLPGGDAPAAEPDYPTAVLDLEPDLYWRLGENGNLDVSGWARHGDVGKGVTLDGLAGPIGADDGAAAFTGGSADSYIDSGYSPFGEAFSIVLWARRAATAQADLLSSTGKDPIALYAEAGAGGGEERTLVWDADASAGLAGDWSNAIPNIGEWFHLVLVYDEGDALLYINGASLGSAGVLAGVLGTDPGNLVLGAKTTAAWGDAVDEFAVFERALEAEEVEALYAARNVEGAPPGPHRVAIGDALTYTHHGREETLIVDAIEERSDFGFTRLFAIEPEEGS